MDDLLLEKLIGAAIVILCCAGITYLLKEE